MGGCCCCCLRRKRAEPSAISTYYYIPRASEEQEPLSSHEAGNSGQSSGFILNPPAIVTPISPYDLNQRISPKPSNSNASIQLTNAHIFVADAKNSDLEQQSASLDDELDLKNYDDSISFVIEECPTCLEEYSEENPKMTTKCDHHFHLGCIYEWLERSDTCPICDKEMEINYHD